MRYLLDTNVCIYIARKQPASVLRRFERLRPGDVGISVVTWLELTYGAWKSAQREANLARLERFRQLVPVLPMDLAAAEHYGRIRATLEREGKPVGAYDLQIAAHAMSLRLTLVTNNVREFSRIPSLRMENWVD